MNKRRILGGFCVATATTVALVALLGARLMKPSIEGNYVLESRELPDGRTIKPPQVMGMMSLTSDMRNFNVYWTEGTSPKQLSTISRYTLSDTEYTETSMFYMDNNISGDGVTYRTAPETGKSSVTQKDGKWSFKLPLHGEPEVVFDGNGFTATQPGLFVDHWKKVQ